MAELELTALESLAFGMIQEDGERSDREITALQDDVSRLVGRISRIGQAHAKKVKSFNELLATPPPNGIVGCMAVTGKSGRVTLSWPDPEPEKEPEKPGPEKDWGAPLTTEDAAMLADASSAPPVVLEGPLPAQEPAAASA